MEINDTSCLAEGTYSKVSMDGARLIYAPLSSSGENSEAYSHSLSTTISYGSGDFHNLLFFKKVSAYIQSVDIQRELEICRRENESLKEQLNAMRMILEHSTHPICQRVFSDGGTSIRIKDGRKPVLKVVFENELYSVCWHGIILGYSIYRDGLIEEVNQTLVFLWNSYAQFTGKMTRSAKKIKRLMQDFFEEI